MTKHINHSQPNSNFWFGFSVGTLTVAGLAYFLATKQGREKLKQIIEYAESVDMPEELFDLLPSIKDALQMVEGNDTTTIDQTKSEQASSTPHTFSLDSLLQKVKTTAENTKTQKKFFVKK